jgi:hypothetical protein
MENPKKSFKASSKTGCEIRIKQIGNDNPENQIKNDFQKLSQNFKSKLILP